MRFACLLPLVLLSACGSVRPLAGSPTSPPEAAASASAPASAVAAAPAQPAGSGDGKFDQIDATNIAEAQAAGYKVVNEKGNTLLCRRDLITGTRLKYVTTCLTAMEWRETSQNAREGVKPSPVYKPYRGN